MSDRIVTSDDCPGRKADSLLDEIAEWKTRVARAAEEIANLQHDNERLRAIIQRAAKAELTDVARIALEMEGAAHEPFPRICPDWGNHHNFIDGACSCGQSGAAAPSRSVQRRVAAQKGESSPEFKG